MSSDAFEEWKARWEAMTRPLPPAPPSVAEQVRAKWNTRQALFARQHEHVAQAWKAYTQSEEAGMGDQEWDAVDTENAVARAEAEREAVTHGLRPGEWNAQRLRDIAQSSAVMLEAQTRMLYDRPEEIPAVQDALEPLGDRVYADEERRWTLDSIPDLVHDALTLIDRLEASRDGDYGPRVRAALEELGDVVYGTSAWTSVRALVTAAVSELEERGRERDLARAEVERMREEMRVQQCAHVWTMEASAQGAMSPRCSLCGTSASGGMIWQNVGVASMSAEDRELERIVEDQRREIDRLHRVLAVTEEGRQHALEAERLARESMDVACRQMERQAADLARARRTVQALMSQQG